MRVPSRFPLVARVLVAPGMRGAAAGEKAPE